MQIKSYTTLNAQLITHLFAFARLACDALEVLPHTQQQTLVLPHVHRHTLVLPHIHQHTLVLPHVQQHTLVLPHVTDKSHSLARNIA